MLFLGVAHFARTGEDEHERLEGAFIEHMMQPINPRIRLAGSLFNDAGARSGLFMVLEADHINTVNDFLQNSPYFRHGLYERVEINSLSLTVGNLQ